MSPREVELAACGTPYLAEPRGENRAVLPMMPTFTDPDDFGRKLRWWLAHPDERLEVAEAAREAVADRTFDHSVTFLLDVIGTLSR
jgi:spore maturation protein CgeB